MRERIMLGGESGSGKTHTALNIIQQDVPAKARFIESDDGARRLLKLQFPDLLCPTCKGDNPKCAACGGGGGNPAKLIVRTVHSWPEFKTQADQIKADVEAGKLGSKDWIVVDGIDIIHNFTRYDFLSKVYAGTQRGEQRISSTWDAIIAKRRGGGPVFEPSDWDALYMEYEGGFNFMIFQSPCHVLVTSSITPIRSGSQYEDQATIAFYRSIGMPMKYDGYKRMPRVFDTLITLGFDPMPQASESIWQFTIWKDRGSRGLGNLKVGERIKITQGFFWDYLIRIAGYGG